MREAQYQFNEGALSTISENRPLMGSTARVSYASPGRQWEPSYFSLGSLPSQLTLIGVSSVDTFRGAEHENSGNAERAGTHLDEYLSDMN